jgi:hypothetical protein
MSKTMLSVLEEITALLIPPTSFFNGLPSDQNLNAEVVIFPAVFNTEPLESEHLVTASMNLKATYPLTLYFLSNDALEDTQKQHDVIIYEQRAQAKKFIMQLLAYRVNADAILYVNEITAIKMTNVINILDQNLTGIMLEMSVEIIDQETVC